MKISKVTSYVLTLTASAVLATVPAVAQLGGTLGGVVRGSGQAQSNRGGLAGDLGLGSTVNGAAQRGNGTLGLGVESQIDGTLSASEDATGKVRETVKDKAAKTKSTVDKTKDKAVEKTSEVKDTAVTTVSETKGGAEEKIAATKDDVTNTAKSASVSSSTDASSNAEVNSQKGSKSASGDLGLGQTLNVGVGGNQISADAKADGKAKGEMKSEKKAENANQQGSSHSSGSAKAENANSGDVKLHGLDRAESRVENNSTADAMLQRNQQRQAEAKAAAASNAKATVSKGKKR